MLVVNHPWIQFKQVEWIHQELELSKHTNPFMPHLANLLIYIYAEMSIQFIKQLWIIIFQACFYLPTGKICSLHSLILWVPIITLLLIQIQFCRLACLPGSRLQKCNTKVFLSLKQTQHWYLHIIPSPIPTCILLARVWDRDIHLGLVIAWVASNEYLWTSHSGDHVRLLTSHQHHLTIGAMHVLYRGSVGENLE